MYIQVEASKPKPIEVKGISKSAITDVDPSIHSKIEMLESRIRSELEAFLSSENTSKAFEPMEKELRYIVHDVVSEFNGLIEAASLGDDVERFLMHHIYYDYCYTNNHISDRHVVVYKAGYMPEGNLEYGKKEKDAQIEASATASAVTAALISRTRDNHHTQQSDLTFLPPPGGTGLRILTQVYISIDIHIIYYAITNPILLCYL
jgi:hypothetical protein